MKLSNMIKTFWIFVIYVELVASQPNWGNQAFDGLLNQPQNVALGQPGCQNTQNSLPNYLTQPGNGIQHVENTFAPNWPLQTNPRINQFSQPPGVVPQTLVRSLDLNQYQPRQAFQQQQQVSQGYQNSLPKYLAQPGNGIQHVENAFTPNWPLKTDPRVNQFSQPPGVFPQTNDLNQYQPHQAFQQQQVSQILPQYEKYFSPLVRPTAPVQYGKPTNVQILQGNPNWLAQNYPNLQDTLARVQAAVATATATAGSSSGSTGAVATATAGATVAPQPISPAIDKDICDAHNAVAYMHKTSTNVLNTWQSVIEAAKEAANCKSTSSYNLELNYLCKIQKDAQNESKNAYSTFAEVKCQVDDLVKKVKDKSYTSTSSKPRNPLKEGAIPPPTTVPQTIPPAIAKAFCDANDAVSKTRNIAEKVYKTLHLVVDAAKEVAKAGDNCKSKSSSNPELNNLNKIYKKAEGYIKPGFDAFAEVQDKVNYLIEKVKCYLNEEPSNDDQPDTENDNEDCPLGDDEEPSNSEDENGEDEYA